MIILEIHKLEICRKILKSLFIWSFLIWLSLLAIVHISQFTKVANTSFNYF